MSSKTLPIEKVSPGLILAQEIKDLPRENVVYKPGIRLTAEVINNILSLEYLELEVSEMTGGTTGGAGGNIPSKKFKSGDFICFKGEAANHIYILKKGVVQVIHTEDKPPADDIDRAKKYVSEHGKVISNIRGTNIKFGEMAAILHGSRSASIRCNTEVEIAMISTNEAAFKKTLLYNPKLALSIAGTMAKRLKGTNKSIIEIKKIYLLLTKKILIYQAAFDRIRASVTSKSETNTAEWLHKLVQELKNIPPLSDFRKFKPKDVERKTTPMNLREQVLPPELESVAPINSYFSLPGSKQENFFILKKGKVVETISENNVIVHGAPGTLLEHINPLADLKGYKDGHTKELKSISPVRLFKIPINTIEAFIGENPPLGLYLNKALAQELMDADHYMFELLHAVEEDLATLASGDTNFRRAFKKLHRLLDKFSKDPALMKTELALATSLKAQVDKDYSLLKDGLNKVFAKKD